MIPTDAAKKIFADAALPSLASSGPMAWTPWSAEEFSGKLRASHPHYRILKLIGHGGMGAVYQATDTQKGHAVAIKVMRPDLLAEGDFVERFHREIQMLRELKHPHIVTLVDRGLTADGVPFLVMPYLEGRSLVEVIQDKERLTLPRILALMQQLCAGTAALHDKGIIHRDLKPANIFLRAPDDHAIILDLGIARPQLALDGLHTQTGLTLGTESYMAPEVKAGKKADKPADIYALGIILYQLLTQRFPEGNYQLASEWVKDPRIDEIIAKAIHAEPLERYKCVAEFAEALKTIQSAAPPATSSAPISDEEYPTPDPASIVIEFGETSLVVNGLDFSLTTTIEDWMQVLGKYSESELPDKSLPTVVSYFWHHLGLAVTTVYSKTDTLYIAPHSHDEFVKNSQKHLFKESASHKLLPFKGTLKINGTSLPFPISLSDLVACDRRFNSACQNGESNQPYYELRQWDRRGRICKWLPGYLDKKDYLYGDGGFGNRSDFLYGLKPICQSADLHAWDGGILSAERCESLFWVAQALVGDSGEDQNDRSDICLLSFTRLLVNQGHRFGSEWPNSLYNTSTDFTAEVNDRPLLHLKGFDSPPSSWLVKQGVIYPKVFCLTKQHIRIVGEKMTSFRIKNISELPWIRRVRPITFTNLVCGTVIGLVIISVLASLAIFALHWGSGFVEKSVQDLRTSISFKDVAIFCGGIALVMLGLFSGLLSLILPFEALSDFSNRGCTFDGFWELRLATSNGEVSIRLPSSSIGSIYHVSVPQSAGQIWLEDHKKMAPKRDVLDLRSGLEGEFGYIALFYHLWVRLKTEPLIRFPGETQVPASAVGHAAASKQSLLPCPTCGKEIAKSARTCPHCGESLRSGQKPSGWRQKACSNCGEVMSRFAQKCQQPDCGHPNTWLKVQSTLATVAVLGGGLWCWQHYAQQQTQGLLLPIAATVLALGWRGSLSLLKSFYSH